jgi:hypothetical protein
MITYLLFVDERLNAKPFRTFLKEASQPFAWVNSLQEACQVLVWFVEIRER